MKHKLKYKQATAEDTFPGAWNEDAVIKFKFTGNRRTADDLMRVITKAISDNTQ